MNFGLEKRMRFLSPRVPLGICAVFVMLALCGSAQAQAANTDAKTSDGKSLAFDRSKGNCLSCHEIKGGDLAGTIGPPLNNMKARFPDRNELIGIVTDETKRNPQTVMPPFGRNLILNNTEISAIVDYLYSL